MKRFLLILCLLTAGIMAKPVMAATSNAGDGRWVNPISDVCWKCLFPMTLGSIQLASGAHPDTPNPASPIQLCPYGIFYRLGLAIGFWEPLAMTDVTREPGVMVNMGGFKIDLGRTGTGRGGQSDSPSPGSFYHVHWYKYPLIFWLNIITSEGCMQTGDMDIAYLSEVDPLWNDSTLAMILNPEVALFSNLLAQGACAADSIASTAGCSGAPARRARCIRLRAIPATSFLRWRLRCWSANAWRSSCIARDWSWRRSGRTWRCATNIHPRSSPSPDGGIRW